MALDKDLRGYSVGRTLSAIAKRLLQPFAVWLIATYAVLVGPLWWYCVFRMMFTACHELETQPQTNAVEDAT